MNYDSHRLSWQLSPRQMHGGFMRQPSSRMPISLYTPTAVEYLPHNSESRRVARSLPQLITTPVNNFQIEHIGRPPGPGLWGKRNIGLLVLYPPARLES